jgi:iron complex transport system substrate-binding protein
MARSSQTALLACALAACASPAPAAQPATRIVSLMPSLTEDLFAIGAGPQVVAVSQFTDYPAAARNLPAVASFSSLDAERVARMHPDLVVGIPAQASLVSDLRRLGIRVVLLRDDSYADIYRDLSELGRLSGHGPEAARVAASLRAEAGRLTVRAPGRRPRVFVVLGVAPIFTVGDASYVASLLRFAGAKNAAGDLGPAYARYSAEALIALQPDAIVADAASGLSAVLDRPPWSALRAVRAHRTYVLRDADLLERPGPRFPQGLAWLEARLHGARR